MKAHVSSILLGVEDLERSKRFYADGLGWKVKHELRHLGVLRIETEARSSASTAVTAWPPRWARARKAVASAAWS